MKKKLSKTEARRKLFPCGGITYIIILSKILHENRNQFYHFPSSPFIKQNLPLQYLKKSV